MNRMAIRRLGLWSVFKFSVVAYLLLFLIGFVMLLVAYLLAMAAGSLNADQQATQYLQQFGIGGGVFLLVTFFGGILASIFYACVNWFGAVFYNLLAMMTGGIEVALEPSEQQQD